MDRRIEIEMEADQYIVSFREHSNFMRQRRFDFLEDAQLEIEKWLEETQ